MLTFSLAVINPVLGELAPEEKMEIKTPSYFPIMSQFKPELGTYVYDVSWQGIPAATVSFVVDKEGYDYKLSTRVKTSKGVSIFYKLKYNANASLSSIDLYPKDSYYYEKENSKEKITTITFTPDGFITSKRIKNGKDDGTSHFKTNNMTLEPFSAAFLARSLTWDKNEVREFDTYVGKSRYIIKLTGLDKIKMDVNGQERDVWVVSPEVKKLGKKKYSKLRKAKIYITADSKRELLEIKSQVFIGSVKTKLESFTPLPYRKGSTLVQAKTEKINF